MVVISSSPENNSFPIGASINLTCEAKPRAEDDSQISRWVKYIRWYGPQSNEVEAQCQQPDKKKRDPIYRCQLVLTNLTVDKFGNYTCQSGNDYPNHCTRKSFNIGIQGKQMRHNMPLVDGTHTTFCYEKMGAVHWVCCDGNNWNLKSPLRWADKQVQNIVGIAYRWRKVPQSSFFRRLANRARKATIKKEILQVGNE